MILILRLVQNWKRFDELKNSLIKLDEFTKTKDILRLKYNNDIDIDLMSRGVIIYARIGA